MIVVQTGPDDAGRTDRRRLDPLGAFRVAVGVILAVLVAGCAVIAVLVDTEVWPLVAMSALLAIVWWAAAPR